MKKIYLILFSIFSGVLFSISWPVGGFPGLLFIALVPMLFIEENISSGRSRFHRFSVFTFTYPGFLIWNALTTYWIYNSTPFGGIAAVMFNAFLMSIVFQFYHWVRRYIYSPHSYFSLIFLWIAFEYLHHNWDLNWPWLSLGNGFASYHKWVQWYEFTGIFGGTFWVILVNILIYKSVKQLWIKNASQVYLIANAVAAVLFIAVPLIISFNIYNNYQEKNYPLDVTVVQPNFDPYTEQYSVPPLEVIKRNLELAGQLTDSNSQFVVCPESAIQENIWERHLDYSPSLNYIKEFLRKNPQLTVIIGASTFKEYLPGEELSHTVRKFKQREAYYDAYNTVFILDTGDITKWYHKSKLTPGVEVMPLVKYFGFIEKLAIDLGGTVGSLGIDKERKVFPTIYDSLEIAAIICYESTYGNWVARFADNDANIIFVITNDGWWGNTPGHQQHFSFSRLRAIETRRSIARSANTGISGFINQRGDAFQMTPYWEHAVIRQKINANWEKTFYVKFGNYIARISAFLAVLLILIAISLKFSGIRK